MLLQIIKHYIQKSYENGLDDYLDDIGNRYLHGEFINQDSIQFPDSLKYYTPAGKVVYGGGGIMPDIFVAMDTTKSSEYFVAIFRKGLLNHFVLSYMDSNRGRLSTSYTTIKQFKTEFDAEKELLEDFIKYADENGVEKNAEQIELSKEMILIRLKAAIARNLWNTSGYYEVISEIDNVLQRAIVEINNNTFKKEKLVYK